MKTKAASPAIGPASILLSTRDPEAVQWEAQQLQLAIARRAYELFEMRGGEHGHDWEDWFRAESELLRPVSVVTAESVDRISIRANVLGFNPHELRISIEARRIMIVGSRQMTTASAEPAANYVEWYPDQIMRTIELPAEVLPEAAIVELQGGLLKFELPRVAPVAVAAAAA